jgi:cobyrinic acid a,c-diamide synthase
MHDKCYRIHRLLGHGKGGYSYLAECEGHLVVIKQIHHEPCDYYSFGNKIEAEQRDHMRLKNAGIRMADAVRMSAETPAHIMGEDHHVGIIRKGYDADITIYDSNIDLQFVMQKGNIVVNNL